MVAPASADAPGVWGKDLSPLFKEYNFL